MLKIRTKLFYKQGLVVLVVSQPVPDLRKIKVPENLPVLLSAVVCVLNEQSKLNR